jgi:hypothetical protein
MMSKEDHPSFYGKDKSNLPPDRQQELFEFTTEAGEILRLYKHELEQLHIDLKFLDIMMREFRR